MVRTINMRAKSQPESSWEHLGRKKKRASDRIKGRQKKSWCSKDANKEGMEHRTSLSVIWRSNCRWIECFLYIIFFLIFYQINFDIKWLGLFSQMKHIIGSLKCALFDSFVPSLDYFFGRSAHRVAHTKRKQTPCTVTFSKYFIIDYLYIYL